MKRLAACILFLCAFYTYGQGDTTKTETYDIIQLKDGHYLKGELISFDPSDGDIIFVDLTGKKYFLGKDDYTSFEENIPVKKPRKSQADFVLNDRKEDGLEVSIGFSVPSFSFRGVRQSDESFYFDYSRTFVPLCLNAGIGKYFTRHHFLGLNIDFGLNSTLKSFAGLNLRYAHQYDSHKKNVALYIPLEIQYNYSKGRHPFSVNAWDTTFYDSGFSATYPGSRSAEITFNSAGISLGHGFAFVLPKKNSIALELSYFRLFVLSKKYTNLTDIEPDLDFKQAGIKFTAKYNF